MNGENNGRCNVGHDNCRYIVDEDAQGNSPVTGEGGNKGNKYKQFTCVEIEVYQVIF